MRTTPDDGRNEPQIASALPAVLFYVEQEASVQRPGRLNRLGV
jgi:hypothetical protein